MLSAKRKISGLTLIELLVIIAVIVVLAAMLLPALADRGSRHPTMVVCMNNQKQIALGFIMWKSDHGDKFPWQVSTTNNGTMESSDWGYAAPNFNVVADYIKNPRVFVCPTDELKTVVTNAVQLHNQNISYFVGLNSVTNDAVSILTGDRHLQANDKPVKPGLFVYSTNAVLNWTRELHGKAQNRLIGGLSFADGHVQFTRIAELNSFFRNQPLPTNYFCVP